MLSNATKAAANVTKGLAEHDIRSQADALESRAEHVIDNVANYATETSNKVRQLIDKTVDDVNSVGKNVESEIKTFPVRSSLIALGAGFILGSLMARR